MLKKLLQNRVAKNAVALSILQAANYAAPLLTLIYLTRKLGVDVYGIVAFSLSIIQISYIILDFGFSLSATQKISLYRERKRYIAKYIGSIFVIKTVLFFLASAIILSYALLTTKYSSHYLIFIFSLAPLMGQTFQPIWFFLGIEKMRHITSFSVSAKILSVILILTFVENADDYILVPIANGIAQISAMAISIYLLYKCGYHIAKPTYRNIRYTLQSGFGFFISRVSVSIYANSGSFILGVFSTPASVAIYSLAEQLYRVMQSIFFPVTQAIYPYMTKEKNYLFLLKITILSLCLAITGSIIGYFVSAQLITYVFGAQWLSIIPILNIFFLAIIINVLSVMSGYPLAAALNKNTTANISTVYGSILYLFCAGTLYFCDLITPYYLSLLVLIAEIYVLYYRAKKLWPLAYKSI